MMATPTTSPTASQHPHACNNAYDTNSISELIQFLHATAFSPSTSTWITAIRQGFFQLWPSLTVNTVTKHLQKSQATAKGHLDQTRANQQSTKPSNDNAVSSQEIDNQPTEKVFATIENSGKIYTDQTGKFPTTSSLGHKYVMVLYDYDSNAILAEPIKNRTGTKILRAYTKLTLELTTKGFKPKIHWLDNKALQALKTFNRTQQINYQLTSPHIHCRNAAERAIQT